MEKQKIYIVQRWCCGESSYVKFFAEEDSANAYCKAENAKIDDLFLESFEVVERDFDCRGRVFRCQM